MLKTAKSLTSFIWNVCTSIQMHSRKAKKDYQNFQESIPQHFQVIYHNIFEK